MGYSYEGPQELLQLRESVRLKIGRLQTVLDALDLYELAPDVPAAAGASAVNGTGRKSASPPVINIYNSTFGALNTGEVLGSIHSNVAAVTGSPSAESFREAAEAFARLVAENRELTDENRSALLETIDIVAEEAKRPPEKRRLRALRGLLAAVPGAIAVSGGAIEAWDRYGPAIRGFFGI